VAREEAMIVAGVGGRRGVQAEELERVVRLALESYRIPAGRLAALATEHAKAGVPAFADAARLLSVRLVACGIAELESVSHRVLTPSPLVLETKGVPSIAEAAALVAAGRNACLLGARVATHSATCALAVGDGP
jgi:cobalt-precorrin 5A hydrolase